MNFAIIFPKECTLFKLATLKSVNLGKSWHCCRRWPIQLPPPYQRTTPINFKPLPPLFGMPPPWKDPLEAPFFQLLTTPAVLLTANSCFA